MSHTDPGSDSDNSGRLRSGPFALNRSAGKDRTQSRHNSSFGRRLRGCSSSFGGSSDDADSRPADSTKLSDCKEEIDDEHVPLTDGVWRYVHVDENIGEEKFSKVHRLSQNEPIAEELLVFAEYCEGPTGLCRRSSLIEWRNSGVIVQVPVDQMRAKLAMPPNELDDLLSSTPNRNYVLFLPFQRPDYKPALAFFGFLLRFSWYSERSLRTNIKVMHRGGVVVEKTKILQAQACLGHFSFIDGSGLCKFLRDFLEQAVFVDEFKVQVFRELFVVIQLLDNFSMRNLTTIILTVDSEANQTVSQPSAAQLCRILSA